MRFKKSVISGTIILVALITIIGLSGLNFVVPQNRQTDQSESASSNNSLSVEKIFLTTEDGVKLAANFYKAENPKGFIVFLHMMPAVKESWDNLAATFQELGYENIAIDLRGHGESDLGPGGYKNFSDAEHQKSILDVDAAVKYLEANASAEPQKIYLVGASIGANLSLQYLSEHSNLKTAVLLSPGLDYRGVKTEPTVKNLQAGQRVFFVSSRDDNDNVGDNQKLYSLVPQAVEKKIQIYDTAGHGTTMLQKEPSLANLIVNFVESQ